MSSADHPLFSAWKRFSRESDSSPFVLAEDRALLSEFDWVNCKNANEYIDSFGEQDRRRLHLELLPLPFVGNLEGASVFILMLNPGLSPGDYLVEKRDEKFREVHHRNLRQENGSDAYPFYFLDPQFSWHPGFRYWQKKLDQIATRWMAKYGCSYTDALQALARSISGLELVPYHSNKFGGRGLPRLHSTEIMVKYVHGVLRAKAEEGKVTIVVARGAKEWGLSERDPNVVVYRGAEVQSSHFTLGSRGGEAIAQQLGLV